MGAGCSDVSESSNNSNKPKPNMIKNSNNLQQDKPDMHKEKNKNNPTRVVNSDFTDMEEWEGNKKFYNINNKSYLNRR